MFLPTTPNIKWNPSEFAIEGREGFLLNKRQSEYFKQFILSLHEMYRNIVNAHNIGAYRSNGSATVANGTTTIAVPHSLGKTPGLNDIQVTPTNDLGTAAKFWISLPTADDFTINVDSDPGAGGATFAWTVHIAG